MSALSGNVCLKAGAVHVCLCISIDSTYALILTPRMLSGGQPDPLQAVKAGAVHNVNFT